MPGRLKVKGVAVPVARLEDYFSCNILHPREESIVTAETVIFA
jgi:hypothetical protein